MARYEEDHFRENFSGFLPPRRDSARGLDPNFRPEGYRGDRMHPGERYQAAYGRYRMHHRRALEGYGRANEGGRAPGRYHRESGQGNDGVRDDDAYLQDYNANSMALRHGPQQRGPMPPRRFGRPEEVSGGQLTHRTDASRNLRDDQGFGRYVGYNSGGFSEPWVGYDPVARKERGM